MLDVVFVVDSSDDVSSEAFKQMLEFVQYMVRGFTINADKIRFSLISYGYKVDHPIKFQDGDSANQIKNLLNFVEPVGGNKDLNTVLQYLVTDAFASVVGGRLDAGKILVLFIKDPRISDPNKLEAYLTLLRSKDVEIIIVSIEGKEFYIDKVKEIMNDSRDLMAVQKIDQLPVIFGELEKRLANAFGNLHFLRTMNQDAYVKYSFVSNSYFTIIFISI